MFEDLSRPLLFAHRGASAHAPENTFEAFDLAVLQGADVLELDVHLTRDDEVVVLHDDRVDRTTDGHGRVRELTSSALQRLDAGHRFRVRGEARFAGRGVTVPRLDETLTHFARTAFNIELKGQDPAIVQPVLRVLERVGPVRLLLTAGDDGVMRALEAARPGVALGLSRGQALEVARAAWFGRPIRETYAGRALQIPPRYRGLPVVGRRLIEAVHRAGIELHLWVIDAPSAAAAWLSRGVDGLMSDDPGALAGIFSDAKAARAAKPSG